MNATYNNSDEQTTLQAGWREFRHLILAGLFGCFAILLVALASWILDEPPAVFTREAQSVLKGSFYVGSFSNLGGVIWFATAAILTFTASLAPSNRGALLLAAVVTWAMGLDDIFMLHDTVYPKLFLSETLVSALYFGTIGVIVVRYHRQLARSTLVGMAVAMMFWVLSAVFDRYFNHIGQLAEDGSKFIGIAVWAAAWIRQAYDDMARQARPGP